MDERTLAERFPIGKSVTTKVVVVGTTRNGIVQGYVAEFIVVEFPKGRIALLPEELQRNDLQHPQCPACKCEKVLRGTPRVPRLHVPTEYFDALDAEDEEESEDDD